MPLACLTRQYQTAWSLPDHPLATLTTEECLWRPADAGLRARAGALPARWEAKRRALTAAEIGYARFPHARRAPG